MGKAKSKNWVLGRWSIDSMSMWDKDYIDAEVPGYFEFGADNLGSFQFAYVQGDVDYRATERGVVVQRFLRTTFLARTHCRT